MACFWGDKSLTLHTAVIPEQMTNKDGAYVYYFNRGLSLLPITEFYFESAVQLYLKKNGKKYVFSDHKQFRLIHF